MINYLTLREEIAQNIKGKGNATWCNMKVHDSVPELDLSTPHIYECISPDHVLSYYHSDFNHIKQPGESDIVEMKEPLVQLIAYSGDAKRIVNSARISFGGDRKNQEFTQADRRLLLRLLNDNHGSPLEVPDILFRLVLPNPIFKQFLRHRIGISVNEVSGRYIDMGPTKIYVPKRYMRQSENNKQGGTYEFIDEKTGHELRQGDMLAADLSMEIYNKKIKAGVSKEQARMIINTGFYTAAYQKFNIRSLFHFMSLRLDSHAQYEAREYAKMMFMAAMHVFPDIFSILPELSNPAIVGQDALNFYNQLKSDEHYNFYVGTPTRMLNDIAHVRTIARG